MNFDDEIYIKNLKVYAYHGVYDDEKKCGQEFVLNIVVGLNFEAAIAADDVKLTIDYDMFCGCVKEIFLSCKFNLLETAAAYTAEQILLKFNNLKYVKLEVYKQNAEFKNDVDLQYVKIKLCRMWHRVYLGIGSNLGDRLQNIKSSITELKHSRGVKFLKLSTIEETQAYGREMADFLNCVAEIETFLSPFSLLKVCNDIELKLKRRRTIKWGPRTIDLDILFFDDLILATPLLTIPHVDLKNRSFVLKPMVELNAGFTHPVCGQTMIEIYDKLKKK